MADHQNWLGFTLGSPVGIGPILGSGAGAATGSVTLTSGSGGAQVITSTAPGQYVTLPSANTCTLGACLFSIKNAGLFWLGLLDGAGNQLGWIKPNEAASVGLASNATAAGSWTVSGGLDKLAVTAQYSLVNATAYLSGVNNSNIQAVAVDTNRTLLIFNQLTAGLWAIMYDKSQAAGSQWGNLVTISAAVTGAAAILQTTNQVLLGYCNGTSVIVLTLSISGLVITLNTAGQATVTPGSGNTVGLAPIVQLGSSYCFGVASSATIGANVFACTVSGTVVTAGSASAVANSTISVSNRVPWIFAGGSTVLRVVTEGSSTTGSISPYTLSGGTTLTLGTAASFTCYSGGIAGTKVLQQGNGNLFILPYASGAATVYVSSLSGSIETSTSAALGFSPTSTSPLDVVLIGNNKACVFCATTSTTYCINLFTDTAGTVSAGTYITYGVATVTAGNVCANGAVGTTAFFVMSVLNSADSVGYYTYSINCSASSAVISSTNEYVANTASTLATYSVAPPVHPTDMFGRRSVYSLTPASSVLYNIDQANYLTAGIKFNQTSVSILNSGILPIPNSNTSPNGSIGLGVSNNDNWILSAAVGTNGINFTKVEAVA